MTHRCHSAPVSTVNHMDRTCVGRASLLLARVRLAKVAWVARSHTYNKLGHVEHVLRVERGCHNRTSVAVRKADRHVDGAMYGSLVERMHSPCLLDLSLVMCQCDGTYLCTTSEVHLFRGFSDLCELYEEGSGLAQETFDMRISCLTLTMESVGEGRKRDHMM